MCLPTSNNGRTPTILRPFPATTTTTTNLVGRRHFFSGRRNYTRGDQQQQSSFFSTNSGSGTSAFNNSKRDPGLAMTSVLSDPQEVEGPTCKIPSRAEQIRRLQQPQQQQVFDVLVIGGGATGAGIALDAAARGLTVACIERGDFASETSSRSTKLIWAGLKYMATASAALLSSRLITHPVLTVKEFMAEMEMVLECHKERKYMTMQQPHLCNWIPIAIPFTTWHVSPPPFGHWLFGFFPVLAPIVMKFYDSLSLFQCPPSYIMTPTKAKEIFPQMSHRDIIYACVFYEAQHNDARTNLAIAMSAAEHGATIANYVEMVDVIRGGDDAEDGDDEKDSKKVVGVHAVDRLTGKTMEIRAKKVIFAGGPFTDDLRNMEAAEGEDAKPAVQGAAGTHIVLPSYYCSSQMGLLDYNTSDGRFLFMLPWQNHTLVGTTDTKEPAQTLPGPPQDEINWLLNECKTYLSPDLKVRRSDVLSAWRGWRPLAVDPHAPPGAPVSRDHVISENNETGVIFIAGGKWTTWRVMAEQVVDRIVGKDGPKCKTLDIKLFGHEGYGENLAIKLIQKYGMADEVAEHLVRTYGGQAWDICEISQPTQATKRGARFGVPIVPDYPYIEAEIVYACREYACTIEDILSRRTRLAFLNKEAALQAVPKVANIMARELGWTKNVTAKQIVAATKYVESYSGNFDNKAAMVREATYTDLQDVFNALDLDGNGFLDVHEVSEIAAILGLKMSDKAIKDAFKEMDSSNKGRVSAQSFENWWKTNEHSPFHKQLTKELGLVMRKDGDLKKIGSGIMFG